MRTTMFNAEINVTPLVDVCLVLLIIFMVILPPMMNGEVELPEASKGSDLEERIFPVTIKTDGTVYLDTLVIRSEEVPAALERLRASAASRPIAIRADKRVAYGAVLDVLGACREAGWEHVTLVAREAAK